MRLVWRKMALKDRFRIMERISEDNPAAAILLDETFRDKARRATRHRRSIRPAGIQAREKLS